MSRGLPVHHNPNLFPKSKTAGSQLLPNHENRIPDLPSAFKTGATLGAGRFAKETMPIIVACFNSAYNFPD